MNHPAHGSFRALRGCFLTFLAAAALYAQAPTGLSVRTATSKRVDLSWSGTAGGYTVQRRVLGGAYANLATVSAATYSDSTVDAYTTYQYQVVANLAGGASSPSNQVTAGPPPAGFSTISPSPGPKDSAINNNFGYDLTVAYDSNGDPSLAYIFSDPNADTNYSDTRIEFRSWNRAQYKWNDPAVVTLAGGDIASRFTMTLSLAYDASIPAWALAVDTINSSDADVLALFSSADGVTWTRKTTFANGSHPSLALQGGNVYLAYLVDGSGLKYVTGKLTADPSTWTTKSEVAVPGVSIARTSVSASLAVDSASNPGIAWIANTSDGDFNMFVMFWRPNSGAAPVKVMDSQNNGTDDPSVRLVYYGLNPRVAAILQRNDAESGVRLHTAKSDNGGATWSSPVLVPPDQESSEDWALDMAVDSAGRGILAFSQNGSNGSYICGFPKIARTSDFNTWSTCDIVNDIRITGDYDPIPLGVQIAYAGNDRVYLLWTDSDRGILMYREPPPTANAGPSLSTVVNGATFQPGVVAGSWTTITGANLSGTTRLWQDADFRGNILPTSLDGVSVKINNLDAPVYYISPIQINVQAPANITGTVNVQVFNNGAGSNTVTANAAANAPGLFTYALGSKTFPSALYNGTYTIVGDPALYSSAAKARSGDIIQLYATGLGTSPAGNIISAPITFSSPVTVTIGSTSVPASFAGLVGVGLFQINFTVPAGLADGDYPLAIRVNNISSQSGVTLPVTH